MNFHTPSAWPWRLAAISCLMLVACADLREDIGDDTYVPKTEGVVFANLALDNAGGQPSSYTFGLTVERSGAEPNAKPIVFPFSFSRNGLFATDLEPGDYKINGTMISLRDGERAGYHPFKSGFTVPFTVKAGQAVYVGDYHLSYTINYTYNLVHAEWRLDKFGNTFDQTSALFRAKHPALKDFTLTSAAPALQDDSSSTGTTGGKDPKSDM